jgi:hypothetical protein
MLQAYVLSVLDVSSGCCKCFILMLQKLIRMLHMLLWLYAMFQVHFSNISSVFLDVCCKRFIWMLHMFLLVFQMYVPSVSIVSVHVLQVFSSEYFKNRSGVAASVSYA